MRQLIKKFNLVLGLIFSLNHSTYAQPQFKIFDKESGLSTNYVTKIVQDKTGYLWVGTANGLNRFDGYSFKVFKNDPQDDNSIANNSIWTLAVDKLDRIWIGTLKGVTCYEPKKNQFTNYKLLGDTSVSVTFIYVDRENLIWIGVGEHGITLLDPQTRKVKKIDLLPYINKRYDSGARLKYDIVNEVFEGKDGTVWLATADGLYQYDKAASKLKPIRLVDDSLSNLRDDFFLHIVDDRSGGFWFASYFGGMSHYDSSDHSFKVYKYNFEKDIRQNIVVDLAWKNEHQFWIATSDRGLGTFDVCTKAFSFLQPSSNFLKIGSLFLDRENVLWAGSVDGLVRVNPEKRPCVFKQLSGSRFKAPFIVRDLIKDPRVNKKFFATRFGEGLLVSDESETNWRSFECRRSPLFENFNIVNDLLNGGGDSLWVVSRDNVRLFDKAREKWIDNSQLQKMEGDFTPFFFNKIIKDLSGDYWISSFVNGACHLKSPYFSLTHFKHDAKINNSICSNNLTSLLQDKLGRIWFASVDNGISIYDPPSNRFTRIGSDKEAHFSILPTNGISRLTQDQKGNVWIASDAGVIKVII